MKIKRKLATGGRVGDPEKSYNYGTSNKPTEWEKKYGAILPETKITPGEEYMQAAKSYPIGDFKNWKTRNEDIIKDVQFKRNIESGNYASGKAESIAPIGNLLTDALIGEGAGRLVGKLAKPIVKRVINTFTKERPLTEIELAIKRNTLLHNEILPEQKSLNIPIVKNALLKGVDPYGYTLVDKRSLTGSKIGDIKGYILGGRNPYYNISEHMQPGMVSTMPKTKNLKFVINYGADIDIANLEKIKGLRGAIKERYDNRLGKPLYGTASVSRNRYATYDMYMGVPQKKYPIYDVSNFSTNKKTVYTVKPERIDEYVAKHHIKNAIKDIEYIESKPPITESTYLDYVSKKIKKTDNGYKISDKDDFVGTMGNFTWDAKKLDSGNWEFIANDKWSIRPHQKYLHQLQQKSNNPIVKKILEKAKHKDLYEFLGVGKPLDVKVGFEYNPVKDEIIKNFKLGAVIKRKLKK